MNTLAWFVVRTFRFGFGPHRFPFLGALLAMGFVALVILLIVLLVQQLSKK